MYIIKERVDHIYIYNGYNGYILIAYFIYFEFRYHKSICKQMSATEKKNEKLDNLYLSVSACF